jgi:hypothetical protein
MRLFGKSVWPVFFQRGVGSAHLSLPHHPHRNKTQKYRGSRDAFPGLSASRKCYKSLQKAQTRGISRTNPPIYEDRTIWTDIRALGPVKNTDLWECSCHFRKCSSFKVPCLGGHACHLGKNTREARPVPVLHILIHSLSLTV